MTINSMTLHNPPVRIASAALSAMISTFALGETYTGPIVAGVIALVSAGLAAFLASLPSLLRVKMERRDKQITFLEGQLKYRAQVTVIVRRSKHKLQNELSALSLHAMALERVSEQAAIPYQRYAFKTYEEICGDEDAQIMAIETEQDAHMPD